MQGGELLLTNSSRSKVQAKFIKSTWAWRQAPRTGSHPVPSPHTGGQRRQKVRSPRGTSSPCALDPGRVATLDEMITPNLSPRWRNDSKDV